ncbi:MAG: FAD-linked oxidase C-terminal domain-containing protein [Candidatus Gastranaerophilales bacterium]|nr:FAD-linked oxidase C-terminal domain-containing protein [Candidatus Gastranaerophilales bacterium]
MIKTKENIDKNLIKQFIDILGKENVLTSQEDRLMYSIDSTAVTTDLYLCDYVLFPSSTAQISEIMKLAHKFKIPVTTRGAGTNMAGACVPFEGGIVICTSKMNKIIEIDKQNQTCTVQCGVIVAQLQQAVEEFNLFYPPDPSNLKVSTIGGSIGMSSSGPRTFKYGGTKDYVLGLEVVMADGQILKTGANVIKDVTGLNLTQLFTGSEGILGIVCEVTLRLIPKPQDNRVALIYFDKIDNASSAINAIIAGGITPSVLDIIDQTTMEIIEQFHPAGFLTQNEAALFIEVDGDKSAIEKQISLISAICQDLGSTAQKIANDEIEKQRLWTARRASFGAICKLRPNVLSEDMVVPRTKMPDMIKKTYEIGSKYGLNISIVGHAGDGNFHPHIAFDLRDKEETQRANAAIAEMFECAVAFGGKISGEHGIGRVKAKYLKSSVDPVAFEYMKKIKTLFDPNNILNPGKVFDYEKP